MNPRDVDSIAVDFLRLARTDLRVAQLILADATLDPRLAGFHAQQAVEKMLKASILLTLREEPGRTHDVSALLRRLPSSWRTQGLEEPLSLLSRWISAGRYPDDLVFSDAQSEQDTVSLAAEAVSLLVGDLRAAGFDIEADL